VNSEITNIKRQLGHEEEKLTRKPTRSGNTALKPITWYLYDYLKFLRGRTPVQETISSGNHIAQVIEETEEVTLSVMTITVLMRTCG